MTMDRLREIAHKIRYANPTTVEIMIGIIGFGWGLTVLNPWIDAAETSPTLRDLVIVAPKVVWGIVVFILSFFIILLPSKSHIRNVGVITNFAFWVFLAVSAFYTSYASLAAPMYIGLACGCLWVYTRRVGILADPDIHSLDDHLDRDHIGFSRDRILPAKRAIRIRK